MTQQINLSLKKLKGIKPKGVKPRPNSNLEKLIQVTDELIEKHSKDQFSISLYDNHFSWYEKMFQEFNADFSNCIEFSESDLVACISYYSDLEKNDARTVITGICSGVLLTVLAENNKKNNKKTILDIDGNNQKFSGLFYCAKYADELTVRNFIGDGICKYFATEGGQVDKLCLFNISGTQSANNCGLKGLVGSLYLINSTNNDSVVSHPFATNVWVVNSNFTSNSGILSIGSADRIWVFNNLINDIDYHANLDKKELFFNVLKKGSDFNRMRYTGDKTYSANFKSFVFYDPDFNQIDLTKISSENFFVGEPAMMKYKKITELSNSLTNKPFEEIMQTLDQIEKIYERIETK